jgi:hypothetical protein
LSIHPGKPAFFMVINSSLPAWHKGAEKQLTTKGNSQLWIADRFDFLLPAG